MSKRSKKKTTEQDVTENDIPSDDIAQSDELATDSPGEVESASDAPTVFRKQDLNVYTVMLLISFVCLTVATVLLVIQANGIGNFPKPYDTSSAEIKGLVNWLVYRL